MSEKDNNNKNSRSPIVVVLGHVDHGKTSLLDFLRKARIAEREAGGITQATGAYEVEKNGKKITFIDTPGHEAFTKMRTRGANIADIAILIVAADDGVKPQTKEAILTLKSENTPYLVVINKIDKNNADVERTKQDLLSNDVMLEGFGGDIPWLAISAKTGEGIDEMLDMILLLAEMQELTWSKDSLAKGFILESSVNKQRGIIASLIVTDGVLKKGAKIITQSTDGSIKLLEDFSGKMVDELEPSSPALVVGFNSLPIAGEEFESGDMELSTLKEIVPEVPPEILPEVAPDILPEVLPEDETEIEETEVIPDEKGIINIVLRSDTSGTLEALIQIIEALEFEDFCIKVLSYGVGDITDNVIKNAGPMQAWIIGFNVNMQKSVENIAKSYNSKIIISDIVYHIVEKIKEEVGNIKKEQSGGKLEVLASFSRQGEKQVIGGKVVKGFLEEKDGFNIVRGFETIGRGNCLNLQKDKKNVKRVEDGECGLRVKSKEEIKVGDILEVILDKNTE